MLNYVFYLPVYMDFRGRIYTYSTLISYQSSDIVRALIDFDNSILITDKNVFYLKLYLSALYGKKFNTINCRIKWVDKL